MKNKILMAIMGVMTVVSMTVATSVAPVSAVTCPAGTKRANEQNVGSYAECNIDKDAAGNNNSLWGTVENIINAALSVIGIVSVGMIIFGGFKMATSGGAADKVKSGKDTIVYGVIGLVVALLAYAIVNFVLSSVFGTTAKACSEYKKKSDCPASCTWTGTDESGSCS